MQRFTGLRKIARMQAVQKDIVRAVSDSGLWGVSNTGRQREMRTVWAFLGWEVTVHSWFKWNSSHRMLTRAHFSNMDPIHNLVFEWFQSEKGQKSNIGGSSPREMTELSYGEFFFQCVRCVSNRKPLGVIVLWKTFGRCHSVSVWLLT